jgi:phage terminase large subunit GpA-like protein
MTTRAFRFTTATAAGNSLVIQEFDKRENAILLPKSRLKISEWAEKNARVPSEGNAEPGKYHLSRMPHERDMLDDPISPGVRESYNEIGGQLGKTLVQIIQCCYCIAELRQSIIMMRQTEDTALDWMRDKFMPTVEDTPCMEGLLKEPRMRDSKSTGLNRKFPGGSIRVIGSKATSKMRSTSSGKLFFDEVDAYLVTKEGDQMALLIRAATTFGDAWINVASTPTLAGFSRIDAGYKRGDQQKYFVPCPHCGFMQWLKTEHNKFSFTEDEYKHLTDGRHPTDRAFEIGEFPLRDTRRAIYICEECKHGWTDSQRIASYMSGHEDNPAIRVNGIDLRATWRPTAAFNGIRSRHLSTMYLTIGLKQGFDTYLHQNADEFLEAVHGGRETFMVWTNVKKTEVFEDQSEKVDWKVLYDRAEDYRVELRALGFSAVDEKTIPVGVMLVEFSMDIQADRVEILSIGFGDSEQSWVLGYNVIYGDFDMPAFQDRVAEHLFGKRFQHPVLGDMAYHSGFVDSGHKQKAVYRFCRNHKNKNVYAIKGFGMSKMLSSIVTGVKERAFGIYVLNFNVDYLKNTVAGNLHNSDGPNSIHFPKSKVFDEKFFQGVCSEKKVSIQQRNGTYISEWRKLTPSERNEPFDMLVYANGGLEWNRRSGVVEWIARKWKEVLLKMPAPVKMETQPAPAASQTVREYELRQPETLHEPKAVKIPEARPERPRSPFKSIGGPRSGGKYNPFGL